VSFVKLDTGILDSTLWAARPQLEIFLAALLKAKPRKFEHPISEIAPDSTEPTGYVVPADWYGFVESSGPGLVRAALLERATGDAFNEGMKALASLAQPEAESRSAVFEGRRMIRVDRGYVILNYMRYRDFDHGAAERMRVFRERKKASSVTQNTRAVTPNDPERSRTVTYAEADAEDQKISTLRVEVVAGASDALPGDETIDRKPVDAQTSNRVPVSDIVELYHAKLPRLPRVEKITDARRGSIKQRWREDLPTLEAWANYFDDVAASDFLMGRSTPTRDRPPFRADFEWLCKPSNFAKVLEGKYHNG
jgi:hypothetical protein